MGRVLRLGWLLGLVLAFPACGVGELFDGGGGNRKLDVPPGQSMSPLERTQAQQVLHDVNAARSAAGLAPLAWDAAAADAAYDHAVDMRLRGFYDHVNPEGLGPCTRLRDAGVESFVCGAENIARGEDTAGEVVAVWMGSDGHRQNILNALATHAGVGVTLGAGGPWWTIDFFTPSTLR